MAQEKWVSIKGYVGFYEISNLGRVKSLPRVVNRANRWGKMKSKLKEKILKSWFEKEGYLRCSLSKNDKIKKYLVHVLIANAFIPNPKKKKYVNHKDGNKLNNKINNLEWCTSSENQIHAFKIGLRKNHNGENHPSNKLTEVDVLCIRDSPFSANYLAEQYKVKPITIYKVRDRSLWNHI